MEEEQPPVKKTPPLRAPDEDLDLKVTNPLPWVAVIVLPLALGLLTMLSQCGKAATGPETAQTKTQVAVKREVVVPNSRIASEVLIRRGAAGRRPQEPNALPACDFAPWVGLELSQDILEAVQESERPYRVLPPGAQMTMDHSPARINFDVDAGGKITRVWCG